MSDLLSDAVEALQSVIGPKSSLELKEDGEQIAITAQQTSGGWRFDPVEVERLTKERAAHQLNRVSTHPDTEDEDPAGKETKPLLISDHVTETAGELLREEGRSYLDAAGNCFLQSGSLLIFIRGQQPKDRNGSHRPVRAFNASGLKLIFALLVRKDSIDWTYRDLAGVVEISRGTVGYVMKDLKRLGFVEERGEKRWVRKRQELIDRWATGYTERLRSKLSRGRFRFLPERNATGWQSHLSGLWATQWGGEPAADLLTGHFRPELLTLYTREATSTVCRELGAAPDPEGSIEILDMFWDPEELQNQDQSDPSSKEHVPPHLVYADLIASADSRARKMAQEIWNQYLAPCQS